MAVVAGAAVAVAAPPGSLALGSAAGATGFGAAGVRLGEEWQCECCDEWNAIRMRFCTLCNIQR